MRFLTKMALLAIAIGFAGCTGIAVAACENGSAVAYEDIDRVLLIRCQVNTGSYPCFRASFALDGDRATGGSINALMGTGLRGTYALKLPAGSLAEDLIVVLREYRFLTMIVSPLRTTVIDAPLNVLAVRHCGAITAIESNTPIDDAGHLAWNDLLDRLQATILSATWTSTSPKFDAKELSVWYRSDGALPSGLMAP